MFQFLRQMFGVVERDLGAEARVTMAHLRPVVIKLIRAEVLMLPDSLPLGSFVAQLKMRVLDAVLQVHTGNPYLEFEKNTLVEMINFAVDCIPANAPINALKGLALEQITQALMGGPHDLNKTILPGESFGGYKPVAGRVAAGPQTKQPPAPDLSNPFIMTGEGVTNNAPGSTAVSPVASTSPSASSGISTLSGEKL
jgi:hypothetical protein